MQQSSQLSHNFGLVGISYGRTIEGTVGLVDSYLIGVCSGKLVKGAVVPLTSARSLLNISIFTFGGWEASFTDIFNIFIVRGGGGKVEYCHILEYQRNK